MNGHEPLMIPLVRAGGAGHEWRVTCACGTWEHVASGAGAGAEAWAAHVRASGGPPTPAPPSVEPAPRPAPSLMPHARFREAERTVRFMVTMPCYGRPEHGYQAAQVAERELRLRFGAGVEVSNVLVLPEPPEQP